MASLTPPKAFQIISSLRYDPSVPAVATAQEIPDKDVSPLNSPYYLLPYHRDRLIDAASYFKWERALDLLARDPGHLTRIFDASIPDRAKPWRLRIVVDSDGAYNVEVSAVSLVEPFNPIPFRVLSQLNVWHVYVDSQPSTPSGFTTHKTTAREDYTAARIRAGILSPQALEEVLMVNTEGQVMEGSITTPYFKRRRLDSHIPNEYCEWITPPLSSGGNAGTTRRYTLRQGYCSEQVVLAAELVDGEECWLSNAVRGFVRGIIMLNKRNGRSCSMGG